MPGPGLKKLVGEVLGEERGREFRSGKEGFHDPVSSYLHSLLNRRKLRWTRSIWKVQKKRLKSSEPDADLHVWSPRLKTLEQH